MNRFLVLSLLFLFTSLTACSKNTEVIYIQRENEQVMHEYIPQDFSSYVLAEEDDILVKITDFYQDEIWGVILEGYIKNETENDVFIELAELLINDVETESIELGTVTPDDKKKFIIEWDYNQLEKLKIDKIKDISFVFNAKEIEEDTDEDVKADNKGNNKGNNKGSGKKSAFEDFNSTYFHFFPYGE